jgi:DNA-binding MarR family transcriptional regulator
MAESSLPHLPIGYWLRKADELLTARIDEAQQAHGLSRLEWQMLNVIHEHGTASYQRIVDSLSPFADVPGLVEGIERLIGRESVEAASGDEPVYRLTAAGEALHAAALQSQLAFRRRAMRGIEDDEYAATIRVLQRLVENLRNADTG